LVACAAPVSAQLSAPSYSNASTAGETVTGACHYARRSSVANNGAPSGSAFGSRYIATVTADNDTALAGCAAKTEPLATDYTVSFTATAAAGAPYKLTVTTQRKGDLNLRDDGGQNAASSDITAGTCSLTNASTFSGTCALADPAPPAGLSGGGNQNAPFDQNQVLIACGTGTGAPVSHALHFVWSQTVTSPSTGIVFSSNADEAAVRLGDDTGLGSETASDYPGAPSRPIGLDGHFVNVAFQSTCGNGIVDGNECVTEQCDEGVNNGTPGSCCNANCTLKSNGTECRGVAGDCDQAETCDGVSASCPADAFLPPSTVCRAVSGGEICDQAENCTGGSATCPADLVLPNGTTCRVSAGICDVTEDCDGVSKNCPANGFVPNSTTCRGSGGVCDPAENCTGSSAACPADAKSTSLCRASGGVCDLAESCDGINDDCPADAKSTAVCRGAGGICDVAEVCDGVADACPADTKVAGGTECRGVAGICDVAEQCDGVNNACPPNAFEPASTVCRASTVGEVCDIAEFCTGTGANCPADVVEPASTVCRASTIGEVCDIAEFCDGTNKTCPADVVEPATTVCRPTTVGEVCDVAEFCDGSNKTCPSDAVEPSSTVCRATTVGEECDAAENCDGSSKVCPGDAVLPNGTTCRASAGVCDVTDTCNGSSKVCPADAKSTAQCRGAAGVCDVAEICDGVGDNCPADGFVSDGTNCDDSNFCNGTQTCTAGVCGGGTGPCPMGQSCDESTDSCFVGDCPVNPVVCASAAKNKLLIKNKADNSKDKLVWKWTKGDATTQTQFADPTTTATDALCFYAGATPTLIEGLSVPPGGGKWSAISTKGYKYKDPGAANDGVTKIIVMGGAAGKSKALVKGKGANLPDFDSDLPIATGDLPMTVQLRNNSNGLCWGGSFATAKKNQLDQFNAKTPP
jgi:hypothetical protein